MLLKREANGTTYFRLIGVGADDLHSARRTPIRPTSPIPMPSAAARSNRRWTKSAEARRQGDREGTESAILMSRKDKRIGSGSDDLIRLRRRNRLATQPLFTLLFLGVFICAFAAPAALLFLIATPLGFTPDRDDGLLFIGGAAIGAIVSSRRSRRSARRRRAAGPRTGRPARSTSGPLPTTWRRRGGRRPGRRAPATAARRRYRGEIRSPAEADHAHAQRRQDHQHGEFEVLDRRERPNQRSPSTMAMALAA